MPWAETCVVKLREEFVVKALEPGANVSDLCREYGISRKSGYKWLKRFKERGVEGLADMIRRPVQRCHPHGPPQRDRPATQRRVDRGLQGMAAANAPPKPTSTVKSTKQPCRQRLARPRSRPNARAQARD